MGFPTIKCEVAFGTGALTDPLAWTDVSAYLHGFSTRRGRANELDKIQAGTAGIRLKNKDGRFTPENAASPYYPNVVPLVPIRLRATFNAITYDIFRGFVEAWPPDFPDRKSSTVEVTASDALMVFNNTELRAYSAEVLADAPVGYWKFDEPVGDLTGSNLGSDQTQAPFTGGYTTTPAPLLGGSTARVFNGVNAKATIAPYVDPSVSPYHLVHDLTIEFWARPDAVPGGLSAIVYGNNDYYVSWEPTRQFHFSTLNSFVGSQDLYSPIYAVGGWHHVVVTRAGLRTTMYVDGVVVGTYKTLADKWGTSGFEMGFGNSASGAFLDWFSGGIAHVAMYDHAISADRVAQHYGARYDTFAAASTGTQIGLVLDWIGWPAGLRTLEDGVSTMQAHVPAGSALAEILSLADAEMGLFFVYGDGKAGFHERHSLHKPPHNTPAATIGDQPGQVPFQTIKLSYDMTRLYTQTRIQAAGGVLQQQDDAPTQAAYGVRTLERTNLLISSDGEASDAATYLLGRFKDPQLRIEEIKLRDGDDSVWPQILGRDIHFDRVTVVKTPPGGAPTITKDVVIESIAHDVQQPRRWNCTWESTPAEPVTYWLLGDATYGLLGTTTRLGY